MNHPAPIIVFVGKPDSGKTDCALWFAEMGLEWELLDMCASNTPVSDNRFLKLTSLRALEVWLSMFKRKKKLFILDEADEKLTNLHVISKLSKEFRVPMGFQIRKFHAKLFLIYHRLKDVPEFYLDKNVTLAVVKKLGKKTALIKSDLLFPLIRQTVLKITNIPRTRIPFNTFGVGMFSLENKKEEEMLRLWHNTIILERSGFEDDQIKAILKDVLFQN